MPEQITALPRSELVPWPDLNPRRRFSEDELEELRVSLAADGMLQPVGVTLQEEAPHWIFAGERRWRAAEGVLDEIPVVVRAIDETTARRLALTENIQRDQLTHVEEAEGLEGYIMASGKTQKEIAAELGKTQAWVSNRLRLLRLPEGIRELIQDGKLTSTQARDLILPFAKIEAVLWKEFVASVDKKLRGAKRELDDGIVRGVVADVAVPMSGWLDSPLWGSEDTSHGIETHVTLRPQHWKTAPKGSLVQYAYDRYSHQSTRCFDAEWWLHAMQKEKRRRDKVRERMMTGDESDSPDLEWTQDDGPIPADTTIPYRQRHVLFNLGTGGDRLYPIGPLVESDDWPDGLYARKWAIHGDPTVIPAEELILYEGDPSRSYETPSVLVRTEEAYDRAAEALENERKTLLEERWKAQAAEDLKRANVGKWGASSLPVLVALSRVEPAWGRDLLALIYELAEDLEIQLPALKLEARPGPSQLIECYRILEELEYLKGDGLKTILAVLRYRFTDARAGSPYGLGLMTRETIRRSVHFELRNKYYQALLELELPFDIPTPTEDE